MLRSWVVRMGGEWPKRTLFYAFTEVRGSYSVPQTCKRSVVNHSSEIQQRSIISYTLLWVPSSSSDDWK
jgi:hypothetical protein